MAAKRGKSQARRTQGNGGGVPGWAWGIGGLLLGIVLILSVPKYLKSDGDGFFRPHPNPDARPAPVESEPDVTDGVEPAELPRPASEQRRDAKRTDFDFYTMLPGKEVPLSDAELAATAEAEEQRDAARQAQAAQPAATSPDAAAPANAAGGAEAPLPAPVSTATGTPAVTATSAPSPAAGKATDAGDSTRYLLQAGAFEASGQAEELKARIAMLGLGARVESARLGGRTVYRVRMGPYGTAGELAEAKRKLAAGGLPGMAIKVE